MELQISKNVFCVEQTFPLTSFGYLRRGPNHSVRDNFYILKFFLLLSEPHPLGTYEAQMY